MAKKGPKQHFVYVTQAVVPPIMPGHFDSRPPTLSLTQLPLVHVRHDESTVYEPLPKKGKYQESTSK